jgi:hypothetical protein
MAITHYFKDGRDSRGNGNSGFVQERVRYAIAQYNELVEKGIIKEAE